MQIYKQAVLNGAGTPDAAALEKINRQAKTALTAEQVYSFSVRLCDDQPDRDYERFDTGSLEELARMFIGKTGIVDHNWSAEGQIARIYDAKVVLDGVGRCIRAEAYMLRTEKNADLIAQIEGGIRREVSVGCAMKTVRCSICGCDYGVCQHEKGQEYEGETCYAVLADPADAYEFSFVAVPAQPRAGVVKAMKRDEELAELKQQAALGRRYLSGLRQEIVRLGLALDVGMDKSDLDEMARALAPEALERIRGSWQQRAEKRFPGGVQLTGAGRDEALTGEFLI